MLRATTSETEQFQFTPLREGRHRRRSRDGAPVLFQFTPLREGRQKEGDGDGSSPRFQFTPLREGRHKRSTGGVSSRHISIHAPPRGATPHPRRYAQHREGFQFTPLREGRPRTSSDAQAPRRHFNSRPSARGDFKARRASGGLSHFNSRPSARGDSTATKSAATPPISIHAPPRGATAGQPRPLGREKNFNSRPSARGDTADGHFCHYICISIHAPPRGATESHKRQENDTPISIHAPPRGATLKLTDGREAGTHFNSRPSARGDPRENQIRRGLRDFNSRPSARGDADGTGRDWKVVSISIHAPPRGATEAGSRVPVAI